MTRPLPSLPSDVQDSNNGLDSAGDYWIAPETGTAKPETLDSLHPYSGVLGRDVHSLRAPRKALACARIRNIDALEKDA